MTTDAHVAAAKTPTSAESGVDGSDLLGDVEFLLARVRAIGSRAVNKALRPLGLHERSYAVLSLACGTVAPTQRGLADFLQLDPSQIVALLDDLQADGLIERGQDSRDRRVNIVTATERGRETYVQARQLVAEARERALSSLAPDEVASLTELLLRVAF